jgi:hypothetical protein
MFVCEIVTSEGQPMGIKNKCGCYGIINILHGWNLICCKQWKDMAGFFFWFPLFDTTDKGWTSSFCFMVNEIQKLLNMLHAG